LKKRPEEKEEDEKVFVMFVWLSFS
jgi:hypothetical protein